MKKSNFTALVMGTVSGMMFALGMCMTLIPQWDAFTEGIIFGSIGIILGLITVLIWRKMNHKTPIKISGKHILAIVVGIVGTLLLGIGMCFCMIWDRMIIGIIIGVLGIIGLLFLIPIISGFKD